MAEKSNAMGVTSLVLGIVSVVFCWVPILGLASGIVGLILAIKQKKLAPNGIATAGLIISIVGLVFSGIYNIFWMFFGAIFGAALASL
jgi:uncharacterized membrane protein YkgB